MVVMKQQFSIFASSLIIQKHYFSNLGPKQKTIFSVSEILERVKNAIKMIKSLSEIMGLSQNNISET